MTQCKNSNPQTLRHSHLSVFFICRRRWSSLTRQVLFLAIAIYDKYLAAIEGSKDEQVAMTDSNAPVVACLWMAWKFLVGKGTTLRDILTALDMGIEREQVVRLEATILDKIDYQLPSDYTYAAMLRQLDGNSKTQKKACTQAIVCQCLRFLQEALTYSRDFSLCAELGPEIWTLYSSKQCRDDRIRQAYRVVTKNKENASNSSKLIESTAN